MTADALAGLQGAADQLHAAGKEAGRRDVMLSALVVAGLCSALRAGDVDEDALRAILLTVAGWGVKA